MVTEFVPIKLTHFVAMKSDDPEKPITVSFEYRGRGRDNGVEGLRLDLTATEIEGMREVLRTALDCNKHNCWPTEPR